MIRDYWDTFIFWLEDNWQVVLSTIIVIVFISVFIYAKGSNKQTNKLLQGENVKAYTLAEVEAMKKESEKLDEVFSMLDERKVGSKDDFPGYDLYLYLKQPFIEKKDLENAVKDLIEIYKWKTDYKMTGIKMQIYDRKEVYEKDLIPRATVYYIKELDEEDLLTEDEGGERLQGDDVLEMNFLDTVEDGEEPDYDEYEFRLQNFEPLKADKGITPLTDQEFSFYLKMDLYRTLKGGSKYGSAKLYLQWDLGKDVYEDGIVAIEREFDEFEERHLEMGGQETYFDNEMILKQELIKENPQFLLFATSNEVEDDFMDAQKRLLELDPDLYKRTLENYIEEQKEDLSDEFDYRKEEGKGEGEEVETGEDVNKGNEE